MVILLTEVIWSQLINTTGVEALGECAASIPSQARNLLGEQACNRGAAGF